MHLALDGDGHATLASWTSSNGGMSDAFPRSTAFTRDDEKKSRPCYELALI